MTTTDPEDVPLRRIDLYVCDLCLTAAGGQCHVPGCSFWGRSAPVGSDLALLREWRQWTALAHGEQA
jgi:hypothetical protein